MAASIQTLKALSRNTDFINVEPHKFCCMHSRQPQWTWFSKGFVFFFTFWILATWRHGRSEQQFTELLQFWICVHFRQRETSNFCPIARSEPFLQSVGKWTTCIWNKLRENSSVCHLLHAYRNSSEFLQIALNYRGNNASIRLDNLSGDDDDLSRNFDFMHSNAFIMACTMSSFFCSVRTSEYGTWGSDTLCDVTY